MSRLSIVLASIIVTFVTMIVVGQILSRFGVGPYWVEYNSPSGIPYQCMYQSKEDWITITLETNGGHNDVEL